MTEARTTKFRRKVWGQAAIDIHREAAAVTKIVAVLAPISAAGRKVVIERALEFLSREGENHAR
ncbi:MAG TPA: hypothetical protein VIE88_00010 [Vicinamibacteria bacterium]